MVIPVGRKIDAYGATLGCGNILYRVKGEHGKVGPLCRRLSLVDSADRMGRIRKQQNAVQSRLVRVRHDKLFAHLRLINQHLQRQVITGPSGDIDWNNHFCFRRDLLLYPRRINIKIT
jgi:hypothetical protein